MSYLNTMKKKKKLTKAIKKPNIKIVVGIALIVLFLIVISTNINKQKKYSAQDFAEILKKNSDAQSILRNIDSDKYLFNIVKLDKRTIEIEQYGPYKALYQGLPESNELYKIRVIDTENKRGLIAVIDMNNKQVLKVYGLLNLEIGS